MLLQLVSAGWIALTFPSNVGAQTHATLDPKPRASAPRLAKGLSRFLGQTRFTSTLTRHPERVWIDGGAASAELGAGVARVGPAGSRSFVVLNPYRGLLVWEQTITDDEPRLIGRVPATGFTPTELHVLEARAIAIEDRPNQTTLSPGSRIITYDLGRLSDPRVASVVEVNGRVLTSKLVGKHLFVAGHRSGVNGTNPWSGRESFVRSYRVDGDKLVLIADLPLRHLTSQQNLLSIRDVTARATLVVAVADDRRWIEVLELSTEDGRITSKLIAASSGRIDSDDWVHVSHERLLVASETAHRLLFESFGLLALDARETISDSEYLYRRLTAEHSGGSAREELRRVLVASTTKQGHSALVKPFADHPAFELPRGREQPRVSFELAGDGSPRATVIDDQTLRVFDPLNVPVQDTRVVGGARIAAARTLTHGGHQYSVLLTQDEYGASAKVVRLDQPTQDVLISTRVPEIFWGRRVLRHGVDSDTGRASLLVEASRTSGEVGAQLIYFDLDARTDRESVRIGDFVPGSPDVLRRAFIHPELGTGITFDHHHLGVSSETRSRVVCLAPEYLGNFMVRAGRADLIARPDHVELRVHAEGQAHSFEAPGAYRAHAVSSDERSVLIWTEDKAATDFTVTMVRDERLYRASVAADDNSLTTLKSAPGGIVTLDHDHWLVFDDQHRPIDVRFDGELRVRRVALEAPPEQLRRATFEVLLLDHVPHLFARRPIDSRTQARFRNERYSENFVSALSVQGELLRFAGPLHHVPGRPVGLIRRGGVTSAILSRDVRPTDRDDTLEDTIILSQVEGGEARLKAAVVIPERLALARAGARQWMFLDALRPATHHNPFGTRHAYRLGFFEANAAEDAIHRHLIALDRPLDGATPRIARVEPGRTSRAYRVFIADGRTLSVYEVNLNTLTGRHVGFEDRQTFPAVHADPNWTLPEVVEPRHYLDVDGDVVRVALGHFGVCEARLSR